MRTTGPGPGSPGWIPDTRFPSVSTTIHTTPTMGCCWSTTTTSCCRARGSRRIPIGIWRSSPGCYTVRWCTRIPRNAGVIYPGLAQRMSAGTGILHSEKNDSWRLSGERHTDPVRFIQMWVTPDDSGIDPGYQQREIGNELLSGGLVTVASGMPQHRDQTAITIAQKNAALHAARIAAGDSVELPPRSSSISSSFAERSRSKRSVSSPRGRPATHRYWRGPRHRDTRCRDPGVGDAYPPGRLTGFARVSRFRRCAIDPHLLSKLTKLLL